MCDVDFDGVEASVFDERPVRARKAHRCNSCGGAISPGHTYTRHFSVSEGHVTSEKACGACQAIRELYKTEHNAWWVPSATDDALHECIEQERDEGNMAMVRIWESALEEMRARREAAK